MLTSSLIHPQILAALARSGHGSQVLISDGNYPHATKRGPHAEVIYLNLAPGLLGVTDVLRALLTAIPIEESSVMDYARSGEHALHEDPPIWKEFATLLADAKQPTSLHRIERHAFYKAASSPDVCLTIATGEQRVYANLLLTIGVVRN